MASTTIRPVNRTAFMIAQHQRGLARAVGADQPDALGRRARVSETPRRAFDAVGVTHVKIVDLKQGKANRSSRNSCQNHLG